MKHEDEMGRCLDTTTQKVPTRQGDKVGSTRKYEQHQLNVNHAPESPVKWNPHLGG